MKKWLKYFLIFGGILFVIVFSLVLVLRMNVTPVGSSPMLSMTDIFNPFVLSFQLASFFAGGVLGLIVWFLRYKIFSKEEEFVGEIQR